MNGEDQHHQRWLTARHEAGHAIAAVHYDCPLCNVSIEPDGISLGAARVAEPDVPQDAIVLFCGPLAERDWADFQPGANIVVQAVGSDLAGLRKLEGLYGDLGWYYREALLFLSNAGVQQQIDRLARALVDRNRLTADEARASAEFANPILPDAHP
jgi:hypothetical protein